MGIKFYLSWNPENMNAIILLRSRNFRLDIIGNKIDIFEITRSLYKFGKSLWFSALRFCLKCIWKMIISEKKALNFRVILTPVNSKLAEGSALNVASNINRILVN